MAETASAANASNADVQHDVQVFKALYLNSIQMMNAQSERFPHPLSAKIGGVIGNNLYKYHNSESPLAAPAGPLLSRLFPGYEKIKECYDQAITVLVRIERNARVLKLRWQYGIVSYPGHYWACARLPMPAVFVHMDPWGEEFQVTKKLDEGRLRTITWEDYHVP